MIALKDFNPDCMDVSELNALAKKFNTAIEAGRFGYKTDFAKEFLGENFNFAENSESGELNNIVLRTIHLYLKYKIGAMNLRLKGEIERAQEEEEICEDLYSILPEWAVW